MGNTLLKKSLEGLGFTPKEAAVYVALLELGTSTVSAIARKAGMNRTTAYDILDTLAGRELVVISGKEPIQEYAAESPERVATILRDRARIAEEQARQAEALVPELRTLHRQGDRPHVRFYEGKEGLEHVYEDTLTSTETIRAYANIDDLHHTLPKYFPEYYKRRAARGIHARAILPRTLMAQERAARDTEEARTALLVPKDQFAFSPEINIYDNKVMIASWREKLGIIIESGEIADAMKKIFELAWAEAKRLHQYYGGKPVE